MKNRTQSVVKADETGFYYNSGIDYPKEVYKHDLETSENEICISEEEESSIWKRVSTINNMGCSRRWNSISFSG